MTQREEFEKWFSDWADPNVGYVETAIKRFAAWNAWQASRAVALEDAAKECDDWERSYMEHACGGDNSGASDFRADGARNCAEGIREMKESDA